MYNLLGRNSKGDKKNNNTPVTAYIDTNSFFSVLVQHKTFTCYGSS